MIIKSPRRYMGFGIGCRVKSIRLNEVAPIGIVEQAIQLVRARRSQREGNVAFLAIPHDLRNQRKNDSFSNDVTLRKVQMHILVPTIGDGVMQTCASAPYRVRPIQLAAELDSIPVAGDVERQAAVPLLHLPR